MKKNTKLIMFILVVVIVGLALFFIFQANQKVSENMGNRENMNIQTNTTIENNNTNQTVENVENTENTSNTLEGNIQEESESSEETDSMEESNTTDPKAKAIEIVKKDWGEDDSVYFSYDGVNSDGKHIVGVRNKSDTTIRYWYDVDINTGTFTIRK